MMIGLQQKCLNTYAFLGDGEHDVPTVNYASLSNSFGGRGALLFEVQEYR